MSIKLSEKQLKVIDLLRKGGSIHVYRTYKRDLHAFVSCNNSINIRLGTVMALEAKGLIKRVKCEYGDYWEGIWAINE